MACVAIAESFSPEMAGTLGEGGPKHSAKKIRRLYQDKNPRWLCRLVPPPTLSAFSRFESKLEQYHGNIGRAAV